jgi:rhodanese-related sulfurtransferase
MAGIVMLAGCKGEKGVDETALLIEKGVAYFSEGTKNIVADTLNVRLTDADATNDPYIIDFRKAADYVYKHIKGAVNVPITGLAAHLSSLPTDKQIVCYCYTGQTASQATAYLNMLGYDASNLKWGMCSWTCDTSVTHGKWEKLTPNGEQLETTANAATEEHSLPTISTGSEDADDIVEAAGENYFAGKTKNIKADSLFTFLLNDGDPSNDPFIVCLRTGTAYDAGHIPGAVNFTYKDLVEEINLQHLPTDRDIVVACYTGQTASQVVCYLRMLEYRAYNLLFGINSISDNDAITDKKEFSVPDSTQDFPMEP